jgi:MSHA biogenesis protein MshI
MGLVSAAFSRAPEEWTGVDLAPDGRYYAARVRRPKGKGHPVVVKCGHSSPVATGAHALAEIAAVGGSSWTMPLGRGDYQMMIVPEPPVSDSEMEASLRWSLASVVDFPLDEAVVAWMRIPTAQHDTASDKQLYVIVSRRAVVDEQSSLFRSVNIPLRAMDVRETALRNLAALVERNSECLGLVTVGQAGVTATFTYRGELYLDRFIAQALPDIVEGEPARQERFFTRLAQQLVQSIDLLARTYPFISVSRIVVAPQPKLPDLLAHLHGRLGVPVEELNLARVLDVSMAPELLSPQAQSDYLAAIGSALRGLTGGATA